MLITCLQLGVLLTKCEFRKALHACGSYMAALMPILGLVEHLYEIEQVSI